MSALSAPANGLVGAVHAAAKRFASSYAQQASLTLVLPSRSAIRWQDSGDTAAARMLVSTLACEWGGRALRINALEVPEGGVEAFLRSSEAHSLLRYVCGAAAQYLTGQTLVCHHTSMRAA